MNPADSGLAIPPPALTARDVLDRLSAGASIQGATGKRFDTLGALSTNHNLTLIRNIARATNPAETLEIGLAFGGSALTFAEFHREAGHAPRKQHVAIDPFQATVWDNVAVMLLAETGLQPFVGVVPYLSSSALPQFVSEGRRFGMIYVDGSHLFEDVFIDFYFAIRLLSENGVIIFDDSTDRHVAKVLRFIRRNMTAHLEELDLTEHRIGFWNRAKHRAARSLGKCQATAFRKMGTGERPWNSPFHTF